MEAYNPPVYVIFVALLIFVNTSDVVQQSEAKIYLQFTSISCEIITNISKSRQIKIFMATDHSEFGNSFSVSPVHSLNFPNFDVRRDGRFRCVPAEAG